MSKLNWSDEDTAILREMYAKGHSYAEIGKVLKRPKSSIGSHIYRLGIQDRNYTQPLPRPAPVHENLNSYWAAQATPRQPVTLARVFGVMEGRNYVTVPFNADALS